MTGSSISVVLIVHNGERFLAEAIQSVFDQTLRPAELLVIDDGSTDRTPAIIEEARRRDPAMVRVLRHARGRNRGMSRTRNLGLSAARGAFTTFLDHDDVMLPDKLRTLAAALEAEPDAIAAVGPNRRWLSWDGGEDAIQDLGGASGRLLPPPGTLETSLCDSSAVPLGPLIRTDAARAFGGYSEAFPGMHEDQAFFARLMLHGPIVLVDEVLHLYRQHEESCVARTHHQGRDKLARRRFLRWLGDDLARRPEPHPTLQRLVASELEETRGWLRRRVQRILINLRRRDR